MRCMHEASLHADNCFVTLTYADDKLPDDGNLRKEDFQKFLKRLRHKTGRFRYFHCGEYGERFGRPHYHACFFGVDFPDRVIYSEQDNVRLYTSQVLADCWGHGFCTVGDLTFESAAYVARYVMKKVTGDRADSHYMRLNEDTGELTQVEPEYVTMSRRPGIGRDWYEKFSTDVFPRDECVVREAVCKPPRYYDGLYEISNPEGFADVKRRRQEKAASLGEEARGDHFEKDSRTGYVKNRRGRLSVRGRVAEVRASLLKRGFEGEN